MSPRDRTSAHDIFPSGKPFSRAAIADVDGLLTATGTTVYETVYGPAGGDGVDVEFDGAEAVAQAAGKRVMPRTISLKFAAAVGAYKIGAENAWVATGTYGGEAVTENLVPTNANGGNTITGTQPFDDPTQVTIAAPGQEDDSGSVEIGVVDIVAPKDQVFRAFKAHAAGSVVTKGQDGKFNTHVMAEHAVEPSNCVRICSSGGGDSSSAIGVTVYV